MTYSIINDIETIDFSKLEGIVNLAQNLEMSSRKSLIVSAESVHYSCLTISQKTGSAVTLTVVISFVLVLYFLIYDVLCDHVF